MGRSVPSDQGPSGTDYERFESKEILTLTPMPPFPPPRGCRPLDSRPRSRRPLDLLNRHLAHAAEPYARPAALPEPVLSLSKRPVEGTAGLIPAGDTPPSPRQGAAAPWTPARGADDPSGLDRYALTPSHDDLILDEPVDLVARQPQHVAKHVVVVLAQQRRVA